MSRTALIVGAGIGGLSAGIALRQAGWNVRIFERSPSPRELGFGVALAPNAIVALRELGVGNLVVARGFEPTRGEVRRLDGSVLTRVEVPRGILGGPMVIALRPALHGALFDAVGADAITGSSEASGFTTADGRVTLHLADGRDAAADVLIGADGVHSVIRRQLHPSEPPPRASDIVSVRGAVEDALHYLDGLSAVYYLGPGTEAMFVRASETGMYWFVALGRDLVPPGLTDPVALLSHITSRFDSTFRAITSMTRELRYDLLVDRDPLPFWGGDIVTLLGDAAHPMLPHTGQGAAQAIVDAVALRDALGSGVDVERALRTYEQARIPKTAALVRQGRRTAAFMRMTNPLGCLLRDAAIRLAPVKPMVKLYARVNRRAGTAVESR